MTDPGPPSFLDAGNPLLSQVPVRLELGALGPAGGTRTGVLTLRSATTTMTVLLSAGELRSWSASLAAAATALDASTVVPASAADVAAIQAQLHPPNGRRPKG